MKLSYFIFFIYLLCPTSVFGYENQQFNSEFEEFRPLKRRYEKRIKYLKYRYKKRIRYLNRKIRELNQERRLASVENQDNSKKIKSGSGAIVNLGFSIEDVKTKYRYDGETLLEKSEVSLPASFSIMYGLDNGFMIGAFYSVGHLRSSEKKSKASREIKSKSFGLTIGYFHREGLLTGFYTSFYHYLFNEFGLKETYPDSKYSFESDDGNLWGLEVGWAVPVFSDEETTFCIGPSIGYSKGTLSLKSEQGKLPLEIEIKGLTTGLINLWLLF